MIRPLTHTVANLGGNASFTSPDANGTHGVMDGLRIIGHIESDQAGTLHLKFAPSPDLSTPTTQNVQDVQVAVVAATVKEINVQIRDAFVNVVYTNGATPQTRNSLFLYVTDMPSQLTVV